MELLGLHCHPPKAAAAVGIAHLYHRVVWRQKIARLFVDPLHFARMARVMVCDRLIKSFAFKRQQFFEICIIMQPSGSHKDLFANGLGARFPLRHIVIFEKYLPVMLDHCRTGRLRDQHSITLIHKTFKIGDVFFGHILYTAHISREVGRRTAAELFFGDEDIYIQFAQYLDKTIADTGVVVVGKTSDEECNARFFTIDFGQNLFRVAVEKAGTCHRRQEPPFFYHRQCKS